MAVRIERHVARPAARFVEALMAEEPAILVEGPRGSGKSALLRGIATARGGAVLDLDDPATARLVAEDPAGAVGGRSGLLLIDEYERVPDVLSVVKREVDRDGQPGRFLLASICRTHGASLATRNVKDFQHTGIDVIDPWSTA